jgi:hypothetical protein
MIGIIDRAEARRASPSRTEKGREKPDLSIAPAPLKPAPRRILFSKRLRAALAARSALRGSGLDRGGAGDVKLELAPFRYAPARTMIALLGDVASCSRLIQNILGHEHVPHRDAAIEVTKVCRLSPLGQLVAFNRLFPIMIRPVQGVPHRPLHQIPSGNRARQDRPIKRLSCLRARAGRFSSQFTTERRAVPEHSALAHRWRLSGVRAPDAFRLITRTPRGWRPE